MRKCTFLGINGWNYSCSQGQFHVSRHIVSIGPKVGEFPSGVLGGNQEEMEGGGILVLFSVLVTFLMSGNLPRPPLSWTLPILTFPE